MDNKYFDIQHIKNFMNGDEASFNIIYKHYNKRVYYMGMQLFHNDEERSKDLVQNTFTQVYMNIKKLKAPEAFYVWMSRIAYLQGCSMLRYHSKDTSYYANNDEEVLDNASTEDKTDEITELQRKEAIDLILCELNTMDENKRLVGYLRYFEELSIKEISEITNIKENTVMSHLHRIKAQLKNKLESLGFTKATCLTLLLVPNLVTYFQVFVESRKPTTLPKGEDIIRQANHKRINMKNTHWMRISKVAIGIGVGFSIVSIAGMETQKKQSSLALPVFTSVEYEKKIINKPIEVRVKTSNNNYDAILLNDSTNLIVYENGNYTLSLVKDGNVVSTHDIIISNLDRNIPQVVKEEIQEEDVVFEFSDDLSGVDYEHISLSVNGKAMEGLDIDMTNKRVRVKKNSEGITHLEIPDKVGNILKININTYNVTAVN